MELHPATIATLDAYWRTFFGDAVTTFDTPQTLVVPHAGMGAYQGIFLFRRRHTLLISVPPAVTDAQRAQLATLTGADFNDSAMLIAQVGLCIDRLIGPAFLGYADAGTFQPNHTGAVRLLTPGDAAAFHTFRMACPPMEWDHGGSAFGADPLAGYFVTDQLVALAGYELWGTTIAHIGVVTHPQQRGRGYGKGVVSFLSAQVLQDQRIPQYRTLCSNTPALQLARALGFVGYAESLAVRLVAA
jgi:GNAT superfamily N-acetyltransferase